MLDILILMQLSYFILSFCEFDIDKLQLGNIQNAILKKLEFKVLCFNIS